MVMTASTMMELGTKAIDFNLPATDGTSVSLASLQPRKALVVLFICNHCPYVIHIAPKLAELAKAYQQQGVAFVAINSNDAEQYPDDSFDKMKEEAQRRGYTFPYAFDETQQVAKAYDAACTPDIFVFDGQDSLVYRGQFDDSRPFRISSGNYDSEKNPATGADLAKALDEILAGKTPSPEQTASLGCNIKWKESE
ncbi:thiol-disulfide isomerase and thioredoxin [Catenovulum agarivorans DS-2]|uniref:Thiol-disulfide isomerase and thioredoxin n=1 Tax=Catenovulum agarivorans DS-2 TaxID=1328313 RepID=W7QD52_9ALTE|nr:thioredoxin family protein [Catenovulum agarivorans]EWH10824.1 thiol-disulfide isomerase and thioredoxin [Catenovulum agarivorans DS-2]